MRHDGRQPHNHLLSIAGSQVVPEPVLAALAYGVMDARQEVRSHFVRGAGLVVWLERAHHLVPSCFISGGIDMRVRLGWRNTRRLFAAGLH